MEGERTIREALQDCLEKDEETNVIPLPLTYSIAAMAEIIYWNACNWAGTVIDPAVMEQMHDFFGKIRINLLLQDFLRAWLDKPARPEPSKDGPCWYNTETILETYNEAVRQKRT